MVRIKHVMISTNQIFAFTVFGLLFLGCGRDTTGDGTTGETTDNETTDGETNGGDGGLLPARGITISKVEANQGVTIPIGVGGDWVDGSARNGRLIQGRRTLIRIHYTLVPDWSPRDIEARLTLDHEDGSTETLTQVKSVTADSDPTLLDGTFWFELEPDTSQTLAGSTYQVELLETDLGAEAGAQLSEGIWANPMSGPRLLGFEDIPMELKMVLVPIHYTGAGMDTIPDLDEVEISEAMKSLHPVTEVLSTLHAPIEYSHERASHSARRA